MTITLESLRIEAGLERSDLAEIAGVSDNTIRLYEEGLVANPRAGTVKKITCALRKALEDAGAQPDTIPTHRELIALILNARS